MKSRSKVFATGVAGIFLVLAAAAGPAGPAADEVRSLRVAAKSESPGSRPGAYTVTYELVNDSEKIITAWDFGCEITTQAGDSLLTRTGVDAYFTLALPRYGTGDDLPWPGELILPGGRVSQEASFDPAELDGPLAEKTCGPVLTVFDGATYEGREDLAETLFARRATDAASVYQTRRQLQAELDRGKTPFEAVDVVASVRGTHTNEPGVRDFGASRLALWRSRQSLDRADVAQLLEELDAYFQAAMSQLPATWQNRVLTAVTW